jgi:phosphatidylglycerophosphate synthase
MSGYNYRRSVKSSLSDELVNIYLLRPIAGLIVRIVYRTTVSPNQLTIAAVVAGLIAAGFYSQGNACATAIGGLFVTLKDLLDSADGQLARAKGQFSRRGRFLDSIGDMAVTIAVFGAIGWSLYEDSGSPTFLFLAAAAALGMTLRVSYHVFYQVSYLHFKRTYRGNRLVEEITEQDRRADPLTLTLQRIFLVLYGWQDRLMLRIDRWCRGFAENRGQARQWYEDRVGLRISGLLGYGTELMLLTVCSLANKHDFYLWVNLLLMNGILAGGILYRRVLLRRALGKR